MLFQKNISILYTFCGIFYAFHTQTHIPSSSQISKLYLYFHLVGSQTRPPHPPSCGSHRFMMAFPSLLLPWMRLTFPHPYYSQWHHLCCRPSDSSLLSNLSSLVEFTLKMNLLFYPSPFLSIFCQHHSLDPHYSTLKLLSPGLNYLIHGSPHPPPPTPDSIMRLTAFKAIIHSCTQAFHYPLFLQHLLDDL